MYISVNIFEVLKRGVNNEKNIGVFFGFYYVFWNDNKCQRYREKY